MTSSNSLLMTLSPESHLGVESSAERLNGSLASCFPHCDLMLLSFGHWRGHCLCELGQLLSLQQTAKDQLQTNSSTQTQNKTILVTSY